MVPDNIGDRPIGFQPQIDHRFRRAARDIAMLSEGLLETSDAPLLALAVPSDGWGERLPLLLWNQRLDSAAERTRILCETALFAPAIDALLLAADDLYDCLRAARICPADTRGLCRLAAVAGGARRPRGDDIAARRRWHLAATRSRSRRLLAALIRSLPYRSHLFSCAIR